VSCPLSCGICSGEFRQTDGFANGCLWDGSFPFSDCCADGSFTNSAGQDCAHGTTQYGRCCAERECTDDPEYIDEQGYPCADWADPALDCLASGYSPGGQDALLAACGMTCASCGANQQAACADDPGFIDGAGNP